MNLTTESKAEHVFNVVDQFWPVPEDPHPNPTDAVNGAREVAELLGDMLEEHALPREQSFCLLVCADKADKVFPFLIGEASAPYIESKLWEPIGIVFGILIVEKNGVMLQTRGFDKSERTDRLLSEAHTRIALDIKAGKLMKVRQN